jgi:hypothetical protein
MGESAGYTASQAEGREFEPRFSLIYKQPFSASARWLFWFKRWFKQMLLIQWILFRGLEHYKRFS